MTQLTPLASALHSKVWPLVGNKATDRCETIGCETIDEENAYMNSAVAHYAPLLLETPVEILGLIWGVHPDEATIWREEIRAALAKETE
jgi:hypothetical protein